MHILSKEILISFATRGKTTSTDNSCLKGSTNIFDKTDLPNVTTTKSDSKYVFSQSPQSTETVNPTLLTTPILLIGLFDNPE